LDSIILNSDNNEVSIAIAPDNKIYIGLQATGFITAYSTSLTASNSLQLMADNNALTELDGIDKNSNLYLRYVRNIQPDLEYRIFNATGTYIAKLQPKNGGDFARVFGNMLYLLSQSGLSIYRIGI
jgi:hypothetical protein